MILSIDPGLAVDGGTGAAIWRESRLAAVGLFASKGRFEQRLKDIHDRIQGFVTVNCPYSRSLADLVVIEKMQVYKRSKGDPEDLIDLSILGGRLSTLGLECRFVEPAAWKGQVPKTVVERLVRERLTASENETLREALVGIAAGKRHNVYDAVGIGLHHLGRWPK